MWGPRGTFAGVVLVGETSPHLLLIRYAAILVF